MTKGIWQDSQGMSDSKVVKQWTDVLRTVEDTIEQLEDQKKSIIKKQEKTVKSEDITNGWVGKIWIKDTRKIWKN